MPSLVCTSLRRTLLAACLSAAFAGASSAQEQLVVAGPGGTFQSALEATVIPRFEKANNVKIIYSAARAADLLAQIKAQGDHPQIDVMLGTDSTHYTGIKLGVYDQTTAEDLPNISEVYDFAKSPKGIGVMYGLQALGIEYNTEVFKAKGWAPPTSWYDIWDPKYKDHVILSSVPSGYAMTFLGMLAVLENKDSGNLNGVWERLEKLKPNVLSYPSAAAQLDQMFQTGGGWIAPNGSGRISALASTGIPVAMAVPKEGAALNPNWMDIVKHAPNRKKAFAFVNYMLTVESQTDVANKMELGPINKNVKLTPEQAKYYSAEVVAKLVPVEVGPLEDKLPEITARFSRLIAK